MSSAENATSERKCAPTTIRIVEAPTPNASAAATAAVRSGGGVKSAGATVQKELAASPEENEQLRAQPPSNL